MRNFGIYKKCILRLTKCILRLTNGMISLVLLLGLLLGFGVTVCGASVDKISLNPPIEGEMFGWSVSSGNYNGDEFADVIVGNPFGNGEVYVYSGKDSFPITANKTLNFQDPNGGFGFYASSGDTNNDGFDDLAVSTDWGVNEVYLYKGISAGLKDTPDKIIKPPAGYPEYGFGHGISLDNDINGDGFSDLLIGASDESSILSNLSNQSSYLYIYYGSESGIDNQNPSFVAYPGTGGHVDVSSAGDLNADGFDDIAISVAKTPSANDFDVYVYRGSSNISLDSPQKISIPTPIRDVYNGGAVASAGDLNGDGFDDLLVGHQYADGAWEMEGKAYIFFGSGSNLSSSPDVVIDNPNPQYNVRFGASLCGIKDFNFDGFEDIVIGCPYSLDNGTAYIYYGSPSGVTNSPSLNLTEEGYFGWAVSPAGDIKGNGQNFIIVGEEFGGAYLYSLNSSNDTAPPDISICSPTPKQHFKTRTIPVCGVASDNIDLSRVEIKVNDCKWQTVYGISSWTSTVTLSKGKNTIYARAIDAAGNIKETSVNFIVC
ncbi:MAG: hypothetical protein EHM20_13295 [Alphaproteobacteria bacterium]|nr:MAG: hypothetical protein EHM20_13295 [Alphaproteobacteria bacterium]